MSYSMLSALARKNSPAVLAARRALMEAARLASPCGFCGEPYPLDRSLKATNCGREECVRARSSQMSRDRRALRYPRLAVDDYGPRVVNTGPALCVQCQGRIHVVMDPVTTQLTEVCSQRHRTPVVRRYPSAA